MTILLNMKGYKAEVNKSTFDWPHNYLNKAKDVGLLSDIETTTYSKPANRGDVAIMALNAHLMKDQLIERKMGMKKFKFIDLFTLKKISYIPK